MNIEMREKAITRVSITGIVANIFLVVFKAGAGLVAGSIALVMDAVNNLTDALSSIITIIGIKLAKKKPDDDHPFGHGRIEYFSAIVISLIVLSAGGTSFVESVKKIINPEMPDYSLVTVVVIVASIFTKLFLGKYVKKQGEKLNSDALIASGLDASNDALISVSTLAGAVITLVFKFSVDGFIGLIISGFIIKAGLEILSETISTVIGSRADSEVTKAIKAEIKSIDGVIGAYDLVLHNYGPNSAMGSVHVEVNDNISAADFHKLTVKIQKQIQTKFHIFLTVGVYAVDISDVRKKQMRENIIKVTTGFEGVVNAHGVYIDDEEKYITYDTCVDFTVTDRHKLAERISQAVNELYPDYKIIINFDTNYSD